MLELFFPLTWILKIAISKTKPYPQMASSSAASPQPWNLELLLFYHRPVQRQSGALYSGGFSRLINPKSSCPQRHGGWRVLAGSCVFRLPLSFSFGSHLKLRTLGCLWQWVTSTLLTLKSSCICCLWRAAAAIKLRLKGQNPCAEGAGAGVTEQGGWPCPSPRCLRLQRSLHTHHPSDADLSPLTLTPLSPQMVFCFSPVGHTLRVRARKFPAIVNCTAIDWFHAWPQEALISVSRRFIEEMEGIEVGCVSLR